MCVRSKEVVEMVDAPADGVASGATVRSTVSVSVQNFPGPPQFVNVLVVLLSTNHVVTVQNVAVVTCTWIARRRKMLSAFLHF